MENKSKMIFHLENLPSDAPQVINIESDVGSFLLYVHVWSSAKPWLLYGNTVAVI